MELQCSLRGFFTFGTSLSDHLSPKATEDLLQTSSGLVAENSDALLTRTIDAGPIHARRIKDHRHVAISIHCDDAAITPAAINSSMMTLSAAS